MSKSNQQLLEEFELPDFPDKFTFTITHTNKLDTGMGKTFSREGLDELYRSMNVYVGARILARWRKTGVAPSKLHVTLEIE